MLRSELIPQTTADLGNGRLIYHFSLQARKQNAPKGDIEHQIAFFEVFGIRQKYRNRAEYLQSHFTELKYTGNTLHWMADGKSHWLTELQPEKWYNFAYDIDFDQQTVGLWASNGVKPLKKVVENVSASASSNSQDWHVGELKTQKTGSKEDWYWSGVYIERAPITKKLRDS